MHTEIAHHHRPPPPICDCRTTGRTGCCRGGFRPGKHVAPLTGPSYERCRELPQIGHRHRRWRWDCTEELSAAVASDDLTREAEATMRAILRRSDGRGKDCWASQEKLGLDRGGLKARTIGAHIAELRAKGWVAVKHRTRITANGIKGRSNLYRPLRPSEAGLVGRPALPAPPRPKGRRAAPSAEAQAAADHVGPAAELVARWVIAIKAMAETEVARLAAKHLPAIVATRPGNLRTRSLAVELANTQGPP